MILPQTIIQRRGEDRARSFLDYYLIKKSAEIASGLSPRLGSGNPLDQVINKIITSSLLTSCTKKQKNALKETLRKNFTKNNTLLSSLSLPMQLFYEKFSSFVIQELQKYSLDTISKQKAYDLTCFLRKFDLRRLATGEKFYPRIIECLCNTFVNDEPVRFIQFACTKRKKTDDGSFAIDISPDGNAVCANIPFLKNLVDECSNLNISLSIEVLFADSENIRVDTQGKNYDNDALRVQRKQAADNLQDYITTAAGIDTIRVQQTSNVEYLMKQTYQWDMEALFSQYRENIGERFPLDLIMKMAFVRKAVDEGNQRNAFTIAEDECEKVYETKQVLSLKDIEQYIEKRYIDKAFAQLTEYSLQGRMIELLYPNAILLQNEKPADIKNSFYQPLRKKILPEINPYSFT